MDYHSSNRPMFYTEQISISFGGLIAVDKVDLYVNQREVVGLIGPNGSGKTTTFNLITGVYELNEGEFYLDGQPLAGKKPHEIARLGVARTFQANRLCLRLSVMDNVLLGMFTRFNNFWKNSLLRRGVLANEINQAHERISYLLNVFNPELLKKMGDPSGSLSQIDRRRVEICRALAMDPKLLLLDEPSAGMTKEEMVELMSDIKKVKETIPNISIIIIEHDMTVIGSISDRVIALNYGKKIAEGTFAEVAANELVREAYLGTERLEDE